MARYREKSPEDLAWNRIRRQITRDLDTRLQNVREDILNELLTTGFQRFVTAMERGEVIELSDAATTWLDEVFRSHAIEATAS